MNPNATYKLVIVWAPGTLAGFEAEVTSFLRDGWQLQGGVAFLTDARDSQNPHGWAQALTRKALSTPPF